jgi:hypothetical protein
MTDLHDRSAAPGQRQQVSLRLFEDGQGEGGRTCREIDYAVVRWFCIHEFCLISNDDRPIPQRLRSRMLPNEVGAPPHNESSGQRTGQANSTSGKIVNKRILQ